MVEKSEAQSESQKSESMIAALLREREGYVRSGKTDRVSQVDEQLKGYGYKGDKDKGDKDKGDSEESRKTPPQSRTADRPRETTAQRETATRPEANR